MDPVSAVGIASAIITFLDFGFKVVSQGFDMYKSADGITEEQYQIQQSLDRLDVLYESLNKPPKISLTANPLESEQELVKIAAECASTAKELRCVVQELVPRPKSVGSAVAKTFKAAFSTKASKYKDRLVHLNGDFQKYMSAALLDRQSSISGFLVKLSKEHRQLGLDNQETVKTMSADLTHLIETGRKSTDEHLLGLERSCQAMQQILLEGQRLNDYHQLLESLYFEGMRDRRHNVRSSHEGTFRWIFRHHHAKQDVGFVKWLLTGSRPFWIAGKAGSGKSTLMKFICQHKKTLDLLQKWAGSQKLVTASFYAWSAGGKLEQSLEGLLRSIIFEILQQCPELMHLVGRNREQDLNWTNSSLKLRESYWSQGELTRILKAFASESNGQRRFCFFIDGMDECDAGDPETSKVLSNIANWPNVKLCVSSRPHNSFDIVFGADTECVLTLHLYTKKDIRRYSAGVLGWERALEDENASNTDDWSPSVLVSDSAPEHDGSSGDKQPSEYADGSHSFTNAQRQTILNDIQDRADGVFLWVFLVVKRLQKSMHNGDTFEEVREILWDLPQNLSGFFEKMLDSIEADYKRSSSEILLMCMAGAGQRISMLAFQFISPLPHALTNFSMEDWILETRKKVKARCTDLVEFNSSKLDTSQVPITYVQFAHRTMIDFLSEPQTLNKIRSQTGASFNPCSAIYENLTRRLPDLAILDKQLLQGLPYEICMLEPLPNFDFKDDFHVTLHNADMVLEAARDSVSGGTWDSIRALALYSPSTRFRPFLDHLFKVDYGFPNRPIFYREEKPKPLQILFEVQVINNLLMHDLLAEKVEALLKYGADPNGMLERECYIGSEREPSTVWSRVLFLMSLATIPMPDGNMSEIDYYKENYSWQIFTKLICSMINAGADLFCIFTYRVRDGTFQEMGSLDDYVEKVVPPEYAPKIRRLIAKKRLEQELNSRAQWSG